MKSLEDQADEKSGAMEDYYPVDLHAEPQMGDVDVALLERFLKMLADSSHPADSDDDYDDLSTQLDDVSRPQNTSAGWPLILTCDCYLLRPREGFEVLQQRVCLSAGVSCTVYSVQILRTFPSITRYLCQ